MNKHAAAGSCLAIALVLSMTATQALADHAFGQFGTAPIILGLGEGVEFSLSGQVTVTPSQPDLSYHLHLFFNEGEPAAPPELVFSPGDVVRFTMGAVSIIYMFDEPSNILDPPFQTFGFFDAANIDDNFAADDPIGLGFAAADVPGTHFRLEVLAGDGLRFSGMELADMNEGVVLKAGSSTMIRESDIRNRRSVVVNFDELTHGEELLDQYGSEGILFQGDQVYSEQVLIDELGISLDRMDGNFLLNNSATPPLNRTGFVGMTFTEPIAEIKLDFAGPDVLSAAAFAGDFVQEDLLFVQDFTSAPGSSNVLEGSAVVSALQGLDGLILFGADGVVLDNLEVTFLPTTFIDFEGLTEGTVLSDQLVATGVTFFGDEIFHEQGVIDAFGVGFERLEGSFLTNQSMTPPLGRPGYVGLRFDEPVTIVRFDFAGPDIQVATFRGDFIAENVVAVTPFTSAPGTTGFNEGSATMADPAGFDGLIIATNDGVSIDNLSVTFLPQ